MTERLPFHFSLSCIGEGNGNPLQCFCLENPRDSGPPSMGSQRVGHDWATELNWSIVSFKVYVSLLIFCLLDLSIGVSGVLKSPIIIMLLLISPFILVSICLTYHSAPMLGAYIFIIVISSSWIEAWKSACLSRCPRVCDPIDGSPPGSPVPGILQARTLKWVAISFSRGSSQPKDWIQCPLQVESLPLN